MQESRIVDVTIIGGGIIGLATALSVSSRFLGRKILLLEKEPEFAKHQSGHNSGVIHSGIYYRPGSLKAKLCREGAEALLSFCERQAIPYQVCGKVIVATQPSELPALELLYQRGCLNGVKGLERIGPERLREIEPHACGVQAIHVPTAAIVDFGKVASAYADLARQQGADLRTSARVLGLRRMSPEWILQTTAGDFRSRVLINCGGLHADRIASLTRWWKEVAIVPFRGEYFELIPQRAHLVRTLVYPVPNPLFPFLGVHFTRMISGKVTVGPNAVLALKREGYRKTDFSLRDTSELLVFPGFWRMAKRYGTLGLSEWFHAFSKKAFLRAAQRLLPTLTAEDLVPGPSGVRAQAVDRQGTLLDDFSLIRKQDAIHLLNVPSPAATASLRIGEMIADLAKETFFSP